MLTIGDHLDVDAVLELAVGWVSRHALDIQLRLASANALQGKQLLLKGFNSRPWIRPERTMAATPLRIPVMNNGNENAH